MIKRIFLTLFLFITSMSFSSHIVGGEFELVHISGNLYRLNVIIYFDVVNGNPGALDPQVTASIFRKNDNARMMLVTIPLSEQNRVDYFQPDCSSGEVVTDRLLYTTVIELSELSFNHQDGYYIAWERCCRNYSIDNIKSVDVNAFPGTSDFAGQTFYLEFPAVVDENGDPFINSSPQLFPPLNDYACPYRPYWVDFAGSDVDGDSLVYSLVTPLNTQAGVAVVQDPIGVQLGANPGPYLPVQWEDGYGLNNIMGGSPDLVISKDGFLNVTPVNEGLYVFAVLCEEFREGNKIGEVRRDFQMLVVDQCPVADPPLIKGKRLTDAGYVNTDKLTVTFPNTTTDENRCVQVQVSDLDASKIGDNFREEVFISAVPLNFKGDVGLVLPDNIRATLLNGSKETFEICFPECPFIDPLKSDYYELAIVAYDDACALPLTDSLYVKVYIEPPVNNVPYYSNSKGGSKIKTIARRVSPAANGNLSININGWDNDNHDLNMDIVPIDFILENPGMSFTSVMYSPGNANTMFNWNFDCNDENIDFNEGIDVSTDGKIAKEFDIMIFIEDMDDCNFSRMDTLILNLIIDFPDQTKPSVYKENEPLSDYLIIEKNLYETIDFNVLGKDLDNDQIEITGEGIGFNFDDFGINFNSKQGAGDPGISSKFSWYLDCNKFNLQAQDTFKVNFFIEDFDDCRLTNRDTLAVDFVISELPNTPPEISFKSLSSNIKIKENTIVTDYTKNIEIEVTGIDFNSDSVKLELLGTRGTQTINDTNYEFTPSVGFQITKSTLKWDLDCQFLDDNFGPGTYDFVFTVTDNHCPQFEADTTTLKIIMEDLSFTQINFNPPNVFTPNGDNTNEYFALEGVHENTNTTIDSGLPEDSCRGKFEKITIVNRWGREVFTSESRDFKWYGEGEATGVYFYHITYTDKEFKGSLSLLR